MDLTQMQIARIERWVLRLQSYDFKVMHIKGRDNVADSVTPSTTETMPR